MDAKNKPSSTKLHARIIQKGTEIKAVLIQCSNMHLWCGYTKIHCTAVADTVQKELEKVQKRATLVIKELDE